MSIQLTEGVITMFSCIICKNLVKVSLDNLKNGWGYCDHCKDYTVDLELHPLTRQYFERVRKQSYKP